MSQNEIDEGNLYAQKSSTDESAWKLQSQLLGIGWGTAELASKNCFIAVQTVTQPDAQTAG